MAESLTGRRQAVKAKRVTDKDVAMAAFLWWRNHRPIGWTLEDHLQNPGINCCGSTTDRKLAESVAACFTAKLEKATK